MFFDLADLAPIAPEACLPCVAKVAGVNMFYTRPVSLCDEHYTWWFDEITSDDGW